MVAATTNNHEGLKYFGMKDQDQGPDEFHPYDQQAPPMHYSAPPQMVQRPQKNVSFEVARVTAVVFQVFSVIGFLLGAMMMAEGNVADLLIGAIMVSTSTIVFLLSAIWGAVGKIGDYMFDQQ